MSEQPDCPRCASTGWVCEDHDKLAWEAGEAGCDCGAPGMPCPNCNADHPPRMAPDTTILWTAEHGWLH